MPSISLPETKNYKTDGTFALFSEDYVKAFVSYESTWMQGKL